MRLSKSSESSVLGNFGPTVEDIVSNSKLEHLYNHEFEKGRFFQVVFSDEKEVHIKFASRTLMKVVYIKNQDDIEGIELVKLVSKKETQRIKFSKFNMQQLITFLSFIKSLDLKGITQRRIMLEDNSLDVIDAETKKKITTLLSGNNGSDLVEEVLSEGILTNRDIVNTGYRKIQLDLFRKLLFENYIKDYKDLIGKPNTKDETAWQHFFNENLWIFGYGLDYRFQGILQKEFSSSNTDADGSNQVFSDFLMGDKRFTTFIELKLPTTELFANTKNRARTWKLSTQLMDAVSQILEQKASGQIKIETTKELFSDSGVEINQKAYDSKAILIIGNWNQIENDNPRVKTTKEKTFELYRRDSRNIDIITYDELYEKACFIVNK